MTLQVIVLAFCALQLTTAQFIRQCTCQEFQSCEGLYEDSLISCSDKCQDHVGQLGANYAMLRNCLLSRREQFKATVGCVERQMSTACANGAPQMVPKRRLETLKLAAINEINNIVGGAGITSGQVMQVARGYGACVMKCVDKSAGACFKRLQCGLALPGDNVIVATAKQCAISSGLGTAGAQSLCQCVAQSGLYQLNGICPRIVLQ